ncbi:MAG: CheY-like chemotaxis protein [Sulfitobacter sp.]|jgi:CheY-like chemotaxis protein
MNDPPDFSIRRAVIIDDESFDQLMYQRILKRSGLVQEIIGFQYADEALAYFEDRSNPEIDVIFLDINLPRMNGFEFLEAAHKRIGPSFAKLVVVMLTTAIAPENRARAAKFDVVRDFIAKPLKSDDVAHVADMLSHRA